MGTRALVKFKENGKIKEVTVRLSKGARGDWVKESYKFHYTVGTDADGDPEHIVTITHPSSKENVGIFTFGNDGMGGIEAHNAFVHKDHRRKGIASQAYQIAANQTGKRVMPSFETSSDADKFWDTKPRKGIQPQDMGKSKDLIPGGKADDKKPSDFPPKSLKQGAKVTLAPRQRMSGKNMFTQFRQTKTIE